MKRYSLTILPLIVGVWKWGIAQPLRRDTDTVVMGERYRNQVYYQLLTGRQDTALRCGWHLAFEVPIRGAAIRANHPCGVTVYKTTRDTTGWGQLTVADTLHPLYDDLCRWDKGAFNVTAGPSAFDVGWGTYNINDHITRGDSLYIIAITRPDQSPLYKKLWIQRLEGSNYFIRVANDDGSADTTYAVDKSRAQGKNFVYLNLLTHEVLDLEPAPQNWDLLFTQYSKFLPSGQGPILYNLTGVLLNQGVRAARIRLPSQASPDTLTPSAYALDSCISVIGDDWKRFDNQTRQWYLADTLYFLVQDRRGNLWRIRFIGFGGSATGASIIEKTLIQSSTAFKGFFPISEVTVYPQPAQDGIYVILPDLASAEIELLSIVGERVVCMSIGKADAFYLSRPTTLPGGVYLLRIRSGVQTWMKRVIFE